MGTYIKLGDSEFADQLDKFANKILTYQIILGITDEEMDSAKADAKLFRWTLGVQNQVKDYAPHVTGFKDLLRYGDGSSVLTSVPVPPVYDAPPALVAANVQLRFTKLADRIKGSLKYTTDIGKDMGIEVAHSPFVPNDGTPNLTGKTAYGGHPLLHYTKGKYEGAQIWKDEGTGYKLLAVSNHPDFLDLSALPAAGTSAVWKYKAIFLYQGTVVGHWSAVIEVTVTGA